MTLPPKKSPKPPKPIRGKPPPDGVSEEVLRDENITPKKERRSVLLETDEHKLREYKEQAQSAFKQIELRMQAMLDVLNERWDMGVDVSKVRETAGLVMDDNSYNAMVTLLERVSNVVVTAELMKYMGTPEAVVEDAIRASFAQLLVNPPFRTTRRTDKAHVTAQRVG